MMKIKLVKDVYWTWGLIGPTNHVVALSPNAYMTKYGAIRAARRFIHLMELNWPVGIVWETIED